MAYAVHHMIPIIVAAVVMAAVGFLTVVFANKSQKLNEEHGYDPAWDKSKYMCARCKFFSICGGQAALKPKDEVEFNSLKEREKQEGKTIPFISAAEMSAEKGASAAANRYHELKDTH